MLCSMAKGTLKQVIKIKDSKVVSIIDYSGEPSLIIYKLLRVEEKAEEGVRRDVTPKGLNGFEDGGRRP